MLFQKTGACCYYCGKLLTIESYTVDHLTPLSRGGDNNLDNSVPACIQCNAQKSNLTETEYINSKALQQVMGLKRPPKPTKGKRK